MRTWKTMKMILKYLFKSTLLIRIIYLFYSFPILFYFISRTRVRRGQSRPCVCANVTTMLYPPFLPTVLYSSTPMMFFFFIAFIFLPFSVCLQFHSYHGENMKQSSKIEKKRTFSFSHAIWWAWWSHCVGCCVYLSLQSCRISANIIWRKYYIF